MILTSVIELNKQSSAFMSEQQDNKDRDVIYLHKENIKLKEILRQCLKARQIAHVKQIIREALTNERCN
jgi:hypothetical protein